MVYIVASVTVMGILVVAILTVNQFSGAMPIIYAAVIGAIVSIPVALVVSKKLAALR
jgi:hypothetical protein